MSGARLCSLVAELGFDGAENLDIGSFEWPFQYDDARPILDWICSSLRSSNVLSLDELSLYDQFRREEKLLDGEDLDQAYDSILTFSSRRNNNQEAIFGAEESIKEIKDSTLAHRAEAIELQKQRKQLQTQYDLLTNQSSSLIQGKRARVAATCAVERQITAIEESLFSRNLQMNEVLGKLASTSQELAHYHHSGEGIYLAYSDFHAYVAEDSSCTKELSHWFAKQLDTGPYRLVAEEGKSNMLREDLENSNHQRSIFGTSERQWIEAQVENAKQQAILMTLKSQVTTPHEALFDLRYLRRKHKDLVEEISTLNQKEEKLLTKTIPELCWELQQLQDTYILQGDYDLKVMRQELYISKQKVFINHLVNQLARHQFLKLACQLGNENMLGAFSLLKVIESELQGYLYVTRSRVRRCLALNQQATSDVGEVDDRDSFLHGVRDLLSIHSNALSTYVSAPAIIQQIFALQSDLEIENFLPDDRNRCINEVCTLIQRLQRLLFASSTTAQPILTPWPLMKELDEIGKVKSKLAAEVAKVIDEYSKKKKIVEQKDVKLQRLIFVDFFCNPEKFRSQVRELYELVCARQASS